MFCQVSLMNWVKGFLSALELFAGVKVTEVAHDYHIGIMKYMTLHKVSTIYIHCANQFSH